MLYEIPFVNGYTEFLEYFSRQLTIETSDTYSDFSYEIELDESKVLDKSLLYSFPEKVFDNIDLKIIHKEDKFWIKITSNEVLKNLKVTVTYTYENTDPKGLYSINYDKGMIYFSEKTDKEYKITYTTDHLITTGKKARQMEIEEYSEVDKVFNIRNLKDNSSIYFLYKNDITEHRNITPILQDLKINYIIKDDTSL